ncbi:MAG: TetR/AcrR family transcriptional regulator [Solirubrobacteraceae bacterium]
MSDRPLRTDARRNRARILDATADAIAADPMASLARIAARAGVSRVTLYAHFPSRDALMDALTARSAQEVTAALTAARPQDGPAGAAMERVLIAASDTIGRYRGLVIINQRLAPAELRRRTGPAIAVVRSLILRGQRSGTFDPELSAEWLLTVVVDLIHSASRQVTMDAMTPEAAQHALLRSAASVLSGHRLTPQTPHPRRLAAETTSDGRDARARATETKAE